MRFDKRQDCGMNQTKIIGLKNIELQIQQFKKSVNSNLKLEKVVDIINKDKRVMNQLIWMDIGINHKSQTKKANII
ncbi:unnamed protein product [Paramecium sonneborni]|uniref:Uncharacterized protein n=1 Tax=Paramecium sonneborni TaxID=65129 RepID=A0A8S1RQX8_9CILI|nr:unnamed protein product [Paramecium sonneborni]